MSKVTTVPRLQLADDPILMRNQLSQWATAMQNQLDERSGVSGDVDNKWLTIKDIGEEVTNQIRAAFGDSSAIGQPVGDSQEATAIKASIDQLRDSFMQSIVYQMLEQAIPYIDLDGVTVQVEEALGNAYAAIGQEQTVRATKDNALASAVNQIWAQMGGVTAVIQDGQLASVSPSAATATKWNQVVASVTDPNTGLINAASIKQELTTYANSANSTFNSIYTVRAQVDVNGRTVVGGFGLAATTGAGSAGGVNIDFGVRADKFFIAATSATPDGTTQENQGNSIPFMVLTSAQFVNGTFYPAGVYMKRATIGDATIGTAKIADAAITNAKIGYSIQSSNWDGSNGWYIDKGGTANFLNIYARGNIQATSIVANTISADQIISGSLNNFYTSTGGSVGASFSYAAQAIRVSVYPQLTSTGNGKDSGTTTSPVRVYMDSTQIGFVVSAGFCMVYNVPPGFHTFTAQYDLGGVYNKRMDVEIILR